MTFFERHVNKIMTEPNTGCWLWIGALSDRRYGLVVIGGSGNTARAHRIAYEKTFGPIPDGMHVLHKCDVTFCVNPDHLFLGTHQDNMNDRDRKGRQRTNPRVGESAANSLLTEEDVRQIRLDSTSTQRELAGRYGVSRSAILQIKRRQNWKHVQ